MEYLTLKQAADRLGVTKKKVYRAVSNGHLDATEGTWRGQTALKVSADDLKVWAEEWLDRSPFSVEEVPQEQDGSDLDPPHDHTVTATVVPQEHDEDTPGAPLGYNGSTFEVPQGYPEDATRFHPQSWAPRFGPPPEAYVAMLDRVARAERRNVELEMEMRKHRLLLAENAESVHEREAKLKETETKYENLTAVLDDKEEERNQAHAQALQAQAEAEELREKLNQITMENETLRTERNRPWWKKMFSAG
jgi:excisionase family DNA binding protein